MRILPIESDGLPVDVILIETQGASRILVIRCGGEQHKLTLNAQSKDLKIHNHSEEEVLAEGYAAELAQSPGGACPCVRVKMWLQQGIYILDIIP